MPESAARAPTRSWGRALVVALVVALVGGAVWFIFLRPESASERGFGDYTFTDPGRIYKGRAALARRPAVVDSSCVYAMIPEYQQILREGLKQDTPRYHFLMVEASKRFNQAVKAAARAGRHDVVAEAGTVTPNGPDIAVPADLTDAVLRCLR